MISDLDPTTRFDTDIEYRLTTLGPFYDNINLYYLLTALSTFYDTKSNRFMFGDKPIDVLAILDPFRVKSPEFLKKDTHLIIYECCAAYKNIAPKFAKMLQEIVADHESTLYQFELTDFVTRSGSIYSKGIPYQLYPEVGEGYYAVETETDIKNETKKLKTTANLVAIANYNGYKPLIGHKFPRDVFMLFTFDKTPENLYNRIVEAFIKAFIEEAPTFLTELTGRINSTKIAVLQKIGKNGPIREALTRNDSKLRSFDLVDSRFKNLFDRNNNGGKKRSSKKSTNSRCGNSKARYYRRSVRVKHRKNTTRKR